MRQNPRNNICCNVFELIWAKTLYEYFEIIVLDIAFEFLYIAVRHKALEYILHDIYICACELSAETLVQHINVFFIVLSD